jgi:hypothetical protein
MATKEERRARMIALDDWREFKIAVFEEIDIVAHETKEETKSEVRDTCEGRFVDVLNVIDAWKFEHALALKENTDISREAVAGIKDLKVSLSWTISGESSVKKGVGVFGWIGNNASKILSILALIAALYAIIQGKWPYSL